MANKLITALKENKDDFRKKFAVTTGVVVATVVAGVVLYKYSNRPEIILLTEGAVETATEALSE